MTYLTITLHLDGDDPTRARTSIYEYEDPEEAEREKTRLEGAAKELFPDNYHQLTFSTNQAHDPEESDPKTDVENCSRYFA